MDIIRTLGDIGPSGPCSLALGTFDGLHRGHMAVIRTAVKTAREKGWEPAVFTFDRSPSGNCAVCTGRDKEKLLERAGIRRMISVDFNEVRDLEAEAFARDVLFDRCGAVSLACGEDFRFGRGAVGDVGLLQRLCRQRGAAVVIVPPVLDGSEKISSTRIRGLIEAGEIVKANRLLGRPFGFSLEVIHGNHIGTGLGTPTINQALPEGFALPRFGVYASWARVDGRYYCGVTNIGVKPTVGSKQVLAETWMPDFSGDLYGRRVRLFLLDFIRPEKKFASLEKLREEIRKNALEAKEIACRTPASSFGPEL